MTILCSISLADWGSIFTIILGAASVFTAIATTIALSSQNNVKKLENQPCFEFSYPVIEETKRKTENLVVVNKGRYIKSTPNLLIYTTIKISVHYRNPDRYYSKHIPIKFYHQHIVGTGNYT